MAFSRKGNWGRRFNLLVDRRHADPLLQQFGASGIFHLHRSLPEGSRLSRKRNRSLFRLAEPGEKRYILKHEKFPFPTWLLTAAMAPIGRREMANLRRVRALGAPAVKPVAAGEVGWGPFFFEYFIVTEEISGSYNLSEWLRDHGGKPQKEIPAARVFAALPRLAAALARLHRSRFYSRTLFAKNLLIYQGGAGEADFAIHDLPRARYAPDASLSLQHAVFDLACLDKWASACLSRAARLRLLKLYLSALVEGPPLRTWVKKILHRRNRLLRRTCLSWAGHRVRRWMKKIPVWGKWWR
ncbi:MAG: hypothetical protein HY717_20090 [Planctomycetes bacterium]|nr:hypothetical protein [Planctomycetota bacterium]